MANEVWEEARRFVSIDTNLSMTERAASVVGGLALAAVGLQPRPNKILSLLAIVAGSALAIRGATGRCGIKAALGGSQGPDDRSAA